MMYKVVNDAISKSYQDLIEEVLTSEEFRWSYQPKITDNNDAKDTNTGFGVTLLSDGYKSEYAGLLYPVLLEGFAKYRTDHKIENCFRIRAGMFVKNQTQGANMPHVDWDFEHYTMLYYVNDSDGPTIIYDESANMVDKIEPVKGRVLIFSGDTIHASSSPKEHNCRIAINYNFKIDERLH